ncbi:MAG: hypothetical protein V1811_00870 [Candidatus Micrarchaeota archaeon]
MPPKPPHLRKHPPHGPPPSPPHLMHAKENKGVLAKAVVTGTTFSLAVALILFYSGIKLEVILPVIAPVWVGSITLVYSHWKRA